ncbi:MULTISPECIES: hypothetical protein [unclassified Lysobacter]|uniref:hypothetical protein n=1 Tax=unclassified Lysobacter TaxID=2635362 RepID=UPI001C22D6D0|nr:hypothetical protein [Lysobacter sp. MMG2]MBU8975771.1 hypothetical protein [Lysobacter sp. MMG2]
MQNRAALRLVDAAADSLTKVNAAADRGSGVREWVECIDTQRHAADIAVRKK